MLDNKYFDLVCTFSYRRLCVLYGFDASPFERYEEATFLRRNKMEEPRFMHAPHLSGMGMRCRPDKGRELVL